MPRIVVVSNRIPSDSASAQAGGLAIAVREALEDTGGIWFGWSGEIRDTPLQTPTLDSAGPFTLAGLDLSPRDYAGYYEEESNRTLWPLLHNRLDLLHPSRESYATYLKVNRRFAAALAPMLRADDLIWVHDFHLFPLGLELRRLGVRAPIGFFLHVPFPPPQVLEALPWIEDMIEDLSGYDLVGFQAGRDLSNFNQVFHRRRRAPPAADIFPIGIDADAFAAQAESPALDPRLEALLNRDRGCAFAIGIDRLDYTKGFIERFEAFRLFLERHPEMEGRISFMQIAARSREDIAEYQAIRDKVESIVGQINGRMRTIDWTPVQYINRTLSHERLAGLYRASRIGLVTPLCDGMNLVAKEYVAAQDSKDPGVLILSKFAGAAEQMTDAVLVNPYDREATADAIALAHTMPLEERKTRWRALMQMLRRHDIHAWRRSFLAALTERGRIRKDGLLPDPSNGSDRAAAKEAAEAGRDG
jgi:trehalose 6-phosphate synthase